MPTRGDLLKVTKKIKKIQEELKTQILRASRHPVHVAVREEPGPFGLRVIVAWDPKAHPGTGMKKVLMDNNSITYGVHGEEDLANLVRKKGWLEQPPDAISFLRLVNLAYFDGIAMLSVAKAKCEKTTQGLEIHFIKREHPSGKQTRLTLTINASGPGELVSCDLVCKNHGT